MKWKQILRAALENKQHEERTAKIYREATGNPVNVSGGGFGHRFNNARRRVLARKRETSTPPTGGNTE